MQRHIRQLLTKYHHPPDKKKVAVQLVIHQAELMTAGVTR